jgi:hypothetical protein
VVHTGENEQTVLLRGTQLDRIEKLEAPGVEFELSPPSSDAKERPVRVRVGSDQKPGENVDLRMGVRDFGEPLVLSRGVAIMGPRPAIVSVRLAPASGTKVELSSGELAAGAAASVLLETQRTSADASVRLGCSGSSGREVVVPIGRSVEGVRAQPVSSGGLFVTFNPGYWQSGCVLTAAIDAGKAGRSDAKEIGRVVSLPRLESFRLTDETAGDGLYWGTITGQNLEFIEKTGWDKTAGAAVTDLPLPVAGDSSQQTLRVRMPWPSPAPHSPLYIWIRGEEAGRSTQARY